MTSLVTSPPSKPYRIGFLVLPKFSLIALSCVMEPLREANWVSGYPLYKWLLITPKGSQVTSSNGTRLIVENNLQDTSSCNMLVVCASFDLEQLSTPEILATLRKSARQGIILGSIDTGSYILARAGLLDRCRATIHWENATEFADRFPKVILTSEIFTIDKNRWTCSGGSSGIDMMLHLIRQQHGAELSVGVAECAILGGIRAGQTEQRMSTRDRLNKSNPSLIAAVQVMEANLAQPLKVPIIASQIGISQRQLERVFGVSMGVTPSKYYIRLRIERARILLRQTSLLVSTIAYSCGFSSPALFARIYRKHFGLPPSKDRAA